MSGRSPALTTVLVLFSAASLIVALDCTTRRSVGEGQATAQAPQPGTRVAPVQPALQPTDLITEDEKNTVEVFQRAEPSTVFVTQKQMVMDFWSRTATEIPAGSGTGFIWDNKGHVVTNFHVIQGARSATVTLHDQRIYTVTVVGTEPRKDIAVLKIESPPTDLVPISVRKTRHTLQVGQKTLAIGNPFGLDHSLTTGIISALGREVAGIGGVTIRDMIQTDAAINPGNSGGPLLDSSGSLIGMNTMIYSQSGSSAGIGFAVPISSIARVVPQIIANGKAEQVGLGINIDPAQRLERRLGISGVVVLSVLEGSPASKAGLLGVSQSARGISLGDIIVEIAGEAIKDYDDLYNVLDLHHPGEQVDVTVTREGKRVTLKTALILIP